MPVHSRFLRYFMTVARLGSLRGAADELHIAASAIDRQIQLGEQTLGVPLFERFPTGLKLTSAGELLFAKARDWSREMADLRAQLEQLRGLSRGTIRLAVIEALANGDLPRLLARFARDHPRFTLQLTVLDNREVAAAIVEGEADIGLMFSPPTLRELTIRAARDYELGAVLPAAHRLAGQGALRVSALAEEPIVAPASPLTLYEHVRTLEAACAISFRRVVACNDIQMAKSMIREGAGVGILCALDVADELRRGELAFAPISASTLPSMTLALITHRQRQLSAPIDLLARRIEAGLFQAPEAA